MNVALYEKGTGLRIAPWDDPTVPAGGLLVHTEACGLCSGELMEWYMDAKAPHVLGHEVAGIVQESDDARFPVGSRVFPHHHAPCGVCDVCRAGHPVHCPQWKATRLDPGGMADRFAVAASNLNDTLVVDDLRAIDAALIEPLACVAKSLRRARVREGDQVAVVGLGVMGLMHAHWAPGAVGYDVNPARVAWAGGIGLDARPAEHPEPADVVVVCPGSEDALRFAAAIARPGARIVLFAPMPPGEEARVPLNRLYFQDVELVSSYSCGPEDSISAARALRQGVVRAEQVVSHFIGINELPGAYGAMKRGEILKPMVVFT
ncbi:MAG: alcohol dehydrogenase catalytic domain-containing protein [Fimbriimonadaceae bacterium]|nr:alcohol dehydrogenase catalytic domain-containing protein [Chthonomonadaceae bacterium]MCO5296157.1 alcohol dehydrogenase catalytic domain-containing protein [Fimbriimonadaceae bacterium]